MQAKGQKRENDKEYKDPMEEREVPEERNTKKKKSKQISRSL